MDSSETQDQPRPYSIYTRREKRFDQQENQDAYNRVLVQFSWKRKVPLHWENHMAASSMLPSEWDTDEMRSTMEWIFRNTGASNAIFLHVEQIWVIITWESFIPSTRSSIGPPAQNERIWPINSGGRRLCGANAILHWSIWCTSRARLERSKVMSKSSWRRSWS